MRTQRFIRTSSDNYDCQEPSMSSTSWASFSIRRGRGIFDAPPGPVYSQHLQRRAFLGTASHGVEALPL